ncbi:serine/threonine-protein kinase [Streptosporangium sp. NPDC002721]|uniref:serine/threonine-protein kinase n=1 Tax=Streptosporangium sp. NPDC002721 TaxID=3366188 RepID=UPI00369665A6
MTVPTGAGRTGHRVSRLAPNGARVAVKVLHASPDVWSGEHTKFLREVEVAKRVPSFATAPVLDVGTEGDVAYIVSEYVDGPSLETLVRGGDPMGPDSLTRLALWTATALRGIHSAGVVHRDFKPANVLLATDGPRVIDFGISKALDHLRTTTQGIQGTPIYMSPEQVSGQAVGPASDVFSWAATMYFAATGRSPFDASTAPAVFYKVMHHQPDLSVLPPALRPHLARCFSRNPAYRPQAMELVMAISGGGTGTAGKA